jgi:plastocyanin
MGKAGKIIIAVLLVAVLAVAAIWVNNSQKDKKSASSDTSQSQKDSTSDNSSEGIASTITYDGSNFDISSATIKSGDRVKIVNDSQTALEFDSDPHPVHTDNKELNVDNVKPGESKTFTITKTGTWGFHNHLNASQRGSITVE